MRLRYDCNFGDFVCLNVFDENRNFAGKRSVAEQCWQTRFHQRGTTHLVQIFFVHVEHVHHCSLNIGTAINEIGRDNKDAMSLNVILINVYEKYLDKMGGAAF